ncbi:hypothetical protein [Sciscionella sediminilitoris]|uniref:hypothetical protein n=1 Tax=Sciscionella sediminilitoris TaxID=1445613 RepID=UPI0012E17745|nr:hypothetical protein [Sciscionella sp. SE31]
MAGMKIDKVELAAPEVLLEDLETFYRTQLHIPVVYDDSRLRLQIGHGTIIFHPVTAERDPFYHFAFLVPGNRFAAAYSWLADRVEILAEIDSQNTVIDFASLNAQACYFHDPAGNIVELIAHRGIAESATPDAAFSADELVGVSEIGLVTPDKPQAARALDETLGLTVWQGELHRSDKLAFLGRQAHTLILATPGRGWLPTGRPAEAHPVRVDVTGARPGHINLANARYQVRGLT